MPLSYRKKLFLFIEVLLILTIPLSLGTAYLSGVRAFFHYSVFFDLTFSLFYFLRIAALIDLLMFILKRFYYKVVKSDSKGKSTNQKLLLTSVLTCFIIGEIIFSFIPQNQGNTASGLAQSIWYMYYYHPINESGYRDDQLKERKENNEKKIFFLGDSFTAGHGINKPENCFSSIVSQKIDKNKFEVFNLGRGNSDTKDEFIRLKEFETKPDLVILQYYHNDIEPVAKIHGHYKSWEINGIKKAAFFLAATIARSSFLINFIAVNGSSKIISRYISGNYKNEIRAAYEDENCINEHLNDIGLIVNYCRDNEIRLYVLFMPDLTDINFTNTVCFTRIKPFLSDNKVPFITLEEELDDYKSTDLIVGPLDNHANEFTHKIIADKILRIVPEFK